MRSLSASLVVLFLMIEDCVVAAFGVRYVGRSIG